MRTSLLCACVFVFSIPTISSAASAADPTPKFGPTPSWVRPAAIPSPDPNKASAPFQFLVSSSQERVLPTAVENYVEYVATPQNAAGLQTLGNIVIPWNVSRSDLTIHKIVIRRDGKTIDLAKPSDMVVLRRENNLERAVLDGIRTVVLPATGLEIGDELDVAFTYNSKVSDLIRRPEDIQLYVNKIPVASLEKRFLVPENLPVQWKTSPAVPKPSISKSDGVTEYVFASKDPAVLQAPSFSPDRFVTPLIQATAYSNWAEIADEIRPGFDKARQVPAKSRLTEEAAKLAASSASPQVRMQAALRLVQDKVRYVALLLGDGAYVPASADETWERKFGDCKGKTALLLALLDKLGIQAEPMLVSGGHDDSLGEQLPSLFLFDHVIVRASIDGKTYYLDATDYGQRTLEELSITSFTRGLPLHAGAGLDNLAQGQLSNPVREVALVWDASQDGQDEYPYQATLTLRGSVAAMMRAKLASATDTKAIEKELKNMVPAIENDDLSIVAQKTDMPDGSFVMEFKGKASMDWSPFEGKRDRRFSFSNGTIKWKVDFERDEGPNKEWPVFLTARPFWERLTETIVLPNDGKRFWLDSQNVKEIVAGTSIERSATIAGNRAVAVSDFRHFKREISAAEARAAGEKLDLINDNIAYVVGPPLPKVKKKD